MGCCRHNDAHHCITNRQVIDSFSHFAHGASDIHSRYIRRRVLLEQLGAASRSMNCVGWAHCGRTDVDAYSYALYIQSMTVGFAIADLAPDLMPDLEKWWGVSRLIIEAIKK